MHINTYILSHEQYTFLHFTYAGNSCDRGNKMSGILQRKPPRQIKVQNYLSVWIGSESHLTR